MHFLACLMLSLILSLMVLPVLPAGAASPKVKTPIVANTVALQTIIKGDAAAGKLKAEDGRCLECHNSDGQGPREGQGLSNGPDGKFANLAGQYPQYIEKQVRDFRTSGRQHDFMAMIAKSVDDRDLADIAAYFASQKRMQGNGKGNNPVGKKLFVSGDASRNITACISCHGEDGKGLPASNGVFPVIGGQGQLYLEKQLLDWRSGERHNDAAGVMSITTKALTDGEIQALTNYISGL